jgi:hypothetical protein
MPRTNVLPLFDWSNSDEEISFKTLTSGVNVIKLFSFVADDEAK